MLVDILIVAFAIGAVFRGREIGFTRQIFATSGLFFGIFLGAWLEKYAVKLVHSDASRGLIIVTVTIGCGLILLSVGEYIGIHLKHRVKSKHIHRLDNIAGSVVAVLTVLLSLWLLSAASINLPFTQLQAAVDSSKIISLMNKNLPETPNIIADLGNLVQPNGYPDVFVGKEPKPTKNLPLPDLGKLKSAVDSDRNSVVKIIGQGCGAVVDGSGFVVRANVVATNAHVVAGISNPHVQDSNGLHQAKVIWFDPKTDFALLKVNDLAGRPLNIVSQTVSSGTSVAVLGYPGGGGFDAKSGVILDEFAASGRDIYGQPASNRNIYEIQTDVIPGNSGGPAIDINGNVVGVIFAESTSYKHVGYALTGQSVANKIKSIDLNSKTVSTSHCAE